MILVLLPFWTSLLVRTSAWIAILEQEGVINDLLVWAGFLADDNRLAMIHTQVGTIVAMVHVLLNCLLAAYTLAWASRISFALVASAALVGYATRLGLILVAFLLVRDAAWMAKVPFGIAIVVTHLVLLAWELRYVSASMAHPGLKPSGSGRPAAGSRR